jgi:hypothetical protein
MDSQDKTERCRCSNEDNLPGKQCGSQQATPMKYRIYIMLEEHGEKTGTGGIPKTSNAGRRILPEKFFKK